MKKQKNLFEKAMKGIKGLFTNGSNDSDQTLLNSLTLVEPTYADNSQITNVNAYYKLISAISPISKSLDELSKAVIFQSYDIINVNTEEPVKSVPLLLTKLLKNPSSDYNFEEFISLIITDLKISGNIFIYITKDESGLGLVRVDPRYVSLNENNQWVFDENGSRKLLDEKFLIHVKDKPDFDNVKLGKGIIASNISLFQNILKIMQFRENFYKNGCSPTGVFSVDSGSSSGGGLAGTSQMRSEIEEKYQGAKNAGTPLVLKGKVDYKQIQMDPTTLKISEELILLYKEVFAVFGMPRFLMELGLRDSGQRFNNHEKQKEHYIKNTIIPLVTKVELLFDNVVKRFSADYAFKFNVTTEIYSEDFIRDLINDGTLTPNQGLKLLNLEESEDKNMDLHLLDTNRIPLDRVVNPVDTSQNNQLNEKLHNIESKLLEAKHVEIINQIPAVQVTEPIQSIEQIEAAEEITKKKDKILNGTPRRKSWLDSLYTSTPSNEIWTYEELEDKDTIKSISDDFLNANTRIRAKKTKEHSAKTRKYLEDTYIDIFIKMNKNRAAIDKLSLGKADNPVGKKQLINAIYDEDDNLVELEKVTIPLYQSVGAASFGAAGSILTINLPFVVTDSGVSKHLDVMRKNGPLVTNSTRVKIDKILTRGLDAGSTHNEIAKDMWRSFVDDDNNIADEFAKIYKPGMKPKDFDGLMKGPTKRLRNRAVLIARTEVAIANKRFTAQSMKDSKVVRGIALSGCDTAEPICVPWQDLELPFDKIDLISNLHPQCQGSIIPVGISSR